MGPGGKGWAGEAAPSRARLCGSPTKLLLPTWPFSGTKAISSETHFFSWTARASSVNETPRQCEDPPSGPGPSSGVCRSWTSTRLSMSHGELACQLDACVCRSWTQAPRPPGGSGLSGSICPGLWPWPGCIILRLQVWSSFPRRDLRPNRIRQDYKPPAEAQRFEWPPACLSWLGAIPAARWVREG